ncbi:MAG: polysaccharide biosynthesis protein [Planctomycetota bacterium]|nr:MAG: polysaccharide biosynthesis protein [Planctomycetota bacterium]
MLGLFSRRQRQWFKVAIDVAITSTALLAAFAIRLGTFPPPDPVVILWILPLVLGTRLPAFAWLGLYRENLARPGGGMPLRVLTGEAFSLLAVSAPLFLFQPPGFPRSVVVIEAALSTALLIAGREVMTAVLMSRLRRSRRREPVIIYGAGNAGVQLAGTMGQDANQEFWPVCFVDDDPVKQGGRIDGLEVVAPEAMSAVCERYGVKRVLLAIPSLPGWKRRSLIERLVAQGLSVSSVPNLIDLVSGRLPLSKVGEVGAGDLLNREEVPPDEDLLRAEAAGRSVLVTGAGGSIGSELCRQIAALGPKVLVLYEISEPALYQIELELAQRFPDLRLAAVLGSVLDQERLTAALRAHEVESVFHAAAYKHVPIVEQNPLPGLWNNVVGTWRAAEAALRAGVSSFVLISTDKAVRPTSVMGASKRAAELACLLVGSRAAELAQCEGRSAPRFTMVRFGNVLDSAGSVVPLFRRQIDAGGPVTVTHPDVTRYFMTVQEAAQLVLQAGAMGKGGEVFLLEMGEPVRIADLARSMIDLTLAATGRRIEIRYTGLRPGEKLHEELLIDSSACEPSAHPKIFRAREAAPAPAAIGERLHELEQALIAQDLPAVLEVLKELVPDYSPAGAVEDCAVTGRSGLSFEPRQPASAPRVAVGP